MGNRMTSMLRQEFFVFLVNDVVIIILAKLTIVLTIIMIQIYGMKISIWNQECTESIDNHKNKGQLFTNRRWKIKKKNHQYIHDKDNKRKRDKYGNYRSNRRFKKRYQLSLQY